MTSMTPRNPTDDDLLAPENAALLLIDFQPAQIYTSVSADADSLIPNIVALAKTGRLFELPIVVSTAQVGNGVNDDTIPQLREQLDGVVSYDRTAINAWEDEEFVAAVRATGRRKLIMAGLWTEVCLVFPALSAMRDGFEVYAVVDCVAGTSAAAHRAGIDRVVQAGAHPVTAISVLCELQRDWNRTQTADGMVQIALERGGAFGNEIALKLGHTSLAAA
jgi:nicotinamidase-related amidase